jgi:hypothetical protein
MSRRVDSLEQLKVCVCSMADKDVEQSAANTLQGDREEAW